MLNWLIVVVVLYTGFVALLYMAQRSLQYFPERGRTAPRTVGLTEAEEVVLDSADGERVIVWHVPPHDGYPVFLYFHGNGGSLRWWVERFSRAHRRWERIGRAELPWLRRLERTADRNGPHSRCCRSLCVCNSPLSSRADRLIGRVAWVRTRDSAGSGSARWCLKPRLPRQSMSARSTIGSFRCGAL
jgi:hypothetical protein